MPILLNTYQGVGFDRFIVGRNVIEWSGLSAAVMVLNGRRGVVGGNVMQRAAPSTTVPPTVLANGTCSVTVYDNVAWYYPSWVPALPPQCP